MTRDHKLILGGGICGIAGAAFSLGLWLIAAGLLGAGVLVVAAAGKG